LNNYKISQESKFQQNMEWVILIHSYKLITNSDFLIFTLRLLILQHGYCCLTPRCPTSQFHQFNIPAVYDIKLYGLHLSVNERAIVPSDFTATLEWENEWLAVLLPQLIKYLTSKKIRKCTSLGYIILTSSEAANNTGEFETEQEKFVFTAPHEGSDYAKGIDTVFKTILTVLLQGTA
jgi:hypothetical protein